MQTNTVKFVCLLKNVGYRLLVIILKKISSNATYDKDTKHFFNDLQSHAFRFDTRFVKTYLFFASYYWDDRKFFIIIFIVSIWNSRVSKNNVLQICRNRFDCQSIVGLCIIVVKTVILVHFKINFIIS